MYFSSSEKQYLSDDIFTSSSIIPVRNGWVKVVNINAEFHSHSRLSHSTHTPTILSGVMLEFECEWKNRLQPLDFDILCYDIWIVVARKIM